jgi:hypothetical protein
MVRKLIVLVLAICALPLVAERRVAVIVDTSGSMTWNDHARFAVQISKILSDLVEDQDQLAIVRFPRPGEPSTGGGSLVDQVRSRISSSIPDGQDCSAGANPALMVELAGSDRNLFKQSVDDQLQYDGPTYFGAPLRTAISFLSQDRVTARLLLIVTDAEEGFGSCKQQYTELLQQFGQTGATVALIRLGGYADDGFANNPAIQFRRDVRDSANLIEAVAEVYQRFLGSKQVQKGRVSGAIRVQIPDHVKDAYLVVAADSSLGEVRAAQGNPAAEQIDFNFRGGGETAAVGAFQNPHGGPGHDSDVRGFRIVHLVNPAAGKYSFLPPAGISGGWMLLEDYSLELRMISTQMKANADSTVRFEIIDQKTGQRVTDPATLTGLRVDGKIDGKSVTPVNDGTGVFSIQQHFGSEGTVSAEMRLYGGQIDKSANFNLQIGDGGSPATQPSFPQLAKAGDIEFGTGAEVNFGRLKPGQDAESMVRFEGGQVAREVEAQVSTDLNKRNVQVEIQMPDGWHTLSASPVTVRVPAGNAMQWPIRLRIGECPAACKATEGHKVIFVVRRADGADQRAEVPIRAEIVPEPWTFCWRRELLGLAGLLLAAFIVYGYLSPYGFPPRVGIQMSESEDLNEGSFLPLRAVRGYRSGFYRDAVLYLTENFRLTRHKRGAFVRLHAGSKSRILIRPIHGRMVFRQQPDESWEPIPQGQDTLARFGVVFRNEAQTLYFELRAK